MIVLGFTVSVVLGALVVLGAAWGALVLAARRHLRKMRDPL